MKLLKPILIAALIAGVLDLIYAYTHFWLILHRDLLGVSQGIASGLIGPDAATAGGAGTAILGLGLEFVITGLMATVYMIAAQRITDLRRFWWIMGPCYGVLLMCVMYWVVVPLSAAHGSGAFPGVGRGADGKLISDHQVFYGTIFAHTILVGLPIAACARFLWPAAVETSSDLGA